MKRNAISVEASHSYNNRSKQLAKSRRTTMITRYAFVLIACSHVWAQTNEVSVAVIADNGRYANYLQAIVEQTLQASDRFALVERERVEDVLSEVSFQRSGITDQRQAVEMGHHLNVHVLIFLQTQRIQTDYNLTLKAIDVETNQIIQVYSHRFGSDADTMRAVAVALARQFIARTNLMQPIEMVEIPSGQFTMGSALGLGDERPVHTVHIESFQIDRYEVSQIAIEDWLVKQGRKTQADIRDATLPATHVSWQDASAFCATRGARLPTEAEWEYAARGNTQRMFPWGNHPPSSTRARFAERTPLPIQTKLQGATPEGVEHMGGNVAEWVQDWWDPTYYGISPAQNPQGPQTGDFRVVRGGSWNQSADELRASARSYHNPLKGSGHIGFRCAQDGSPKTH